MHRWLPLLVVLLAAPAAHAEDTKLTAAKAHFKQGKAYQDAGAYDRAVVEYEAAYALAPLPDLLFNIGQVRRLLGEKEKAVEAYGAYVKAVPEGKAADEARGHIAALTKELDDQRRALANDEEARRATDEEARRVATLPATTTPPAATRGRGLRIAGAAAVGTGVILVGVAAIFGSVAADKSDFLSANDGPWTQDHIDAIAAGEDAERAMLISAGLGAAALAGGAVLYYFGRRAAAERPAATALVPTARGLAVVGVF